MQTARGVALSTLGEIFQDGAFSNIALKKSLGKATLSDVDKSLVTEIVYGDGFTQTNLGMVSIALCR